jgi:transcriptional regulator of acetoin/glycerol metabolism
MVYELSSYVTGDVPITAEDVRQYLAGSASECDTSSRAHQVFPRKGDIVVPVDICIIRDGETLKQWEMRVRKRAIEAARQTEGHMPAAARRLGVAHSTLKQHLRLASQMVEN